MTRHDGGLSYLLDLDGEIMEQAGGHWVKMEVKRVTPSEQRPYGIKYSLSLHAPNGRRILGFDNAHGGKGRAWYRVVPYDHQHRDSSRRSRPYKFSSADKLVGDFFSAVDRALKKRGVVP